MKFKKIFVGIILFCCVIFISWKFFGFPFNLLQYNSSKNQQTDQNLFNVRVIINTGDSVATYDGVPASTVINALTSVSKNKHIELKTRQYDFGVFVQRIGDLENSKDKAWIYYVNGTSGDVAADKKIVKSGDVIEWRYTKPIY